MVGILKPVLESAGADFWVDLGDFVDADIGVYWTQDHANALYTRALWGISSIAHSLPFIPVVGNHETINQYYGTDGCPSGSPLLDIRCQDVTGARYGEPLFEYQGNARTTFFPLYSHGVASLNPDYKTFFAWEWGDALCIALDPYLYTTEYPTHCDGVKPVFTLGDAQKNWLLDLLNNDHHNWIFIFIHQHGGQSPNTQDFYAGGHWQEECYGRGGAATVPYSVQLDEWISSIIGYNNVIIFLGHDHVFSTGVYEGLRFFTCPTPTTWWNWSLDELGYRGEDWIYHEEETFSATVSSIDIRQGKVYVSDYNPPPATSEIYKYFTMLVLRNYGREGHYKRFQRAIKKVDPNNPSIGFDNGFVVTGNNGYLYVSKDGEGPIDHSLGEWKAGDQIYVHRVAGGVETVEVTAKKVVVSMLDTEGKQVVYPSLYDHAGREVKFTICSEQEDDGDGDGVGDACDICPSTPNGLNLGTCTKGTIVQSCTSNEECGTNGFCSMKQEDADSDYLGDACDECTDTDKDGYGNPEFIINTCADDNCPYTLNPNQQDTYPPQGNGIGDACDCESDFSCDGDVDANDVSTFLQHFGRSEYNRPCTNEDQCKGDFGCDGGVDAGDVTKFLEDFGRSKYNNPCPVCQVGNWCVYP